MNIDDRLEKLADRVDALTRSVELLTSFHRDNEQRIMERADRNEERMGQMIGHMEQMIDAVTRLANIAGAHERRITDLEDQP